uniref:G patch domain-containing protein n=1 Tax=Xiphophorus maculatus TaxID=8083 RepID=M4AUS2_XIPMA
MAADSEEDFVSFGTPLEPLEEGEPLKKPVPLHEQTVKDEKGRYQRFHGAFTGGFSAGYFNTVGSKEGWTPSTFVSSRQQKAEKHHARPEDFMDEEVKHRGCSLDRLQFVLGDRLETDWVRRDMLDSDSRSADRI